MFPQNPNIRIERKHVEEIKFPLAFKLCVDTEKKDIVKSNRKFGYTDFFQGQSRFNKSIRGWNGHTRNNSNLGTVKGLY